MPREHDVEPANAILDSTFRAKHVLLPEIHQRVLDALFRDALVEQLFEHAEAELLERFREKLAVFDGA